MHEVFSLFAGAHGTLPKTSKIQSWHGAFDDLMTLCKCAPIISVFKKLFLFDSNLFFFSF
jgi:hypothetical protein